MDTHTLGIYMWLFLHSCLQKCCLCQYQYAGYISVDFYACLCRCSCMFAHILYLHAFVSYYLHFESVYVVLLSATMVSELLFIWMFCVLNWYFSLCATISLTALCSLEPTDTQTLWICVTVSLCNLTSWLTLLLLCYLEMHQLFAFDV